MMARFIAAPQVRALKVFGRKRFGVSQFLSYICPLRLPGLKYPRHGKVFDAPASGDYTNTIVFFPWFDLEDPS
jgi:hypothetical protein